MKLAKITHKTNYIFILYFENGESKESDLQALIGKHVAIKDIHTAQVNTEWGCLEFNEGMVDIEPKTLYCYACSMDVQNKIKAA